jgi:hypothetical protein
MSTKETEVNIRNMTVHCGGADANAKINSAVRYKLYRDFKTCIKRNVLAYLCDFMRFSM